METTLTLPANQYSYYHKLMLANARKKLRFWDLGKKKTHPKGFGTDSYVLKFGHVSSSVNELTQGVAPGASTIDTNKYTVVLKQYGQHIPLSDWVITTSIDPVLEDVSEELGYTAGVSTDEVIRNELLASATTNIQYVGAGNTADNDIAATEVFSATDALKAVRVLKGGDAPMFDDDMYVWVVHPYNTIDIMSDTSAGGFIELNKYVAGLADGPLKGEVGKAYGARVMETTSISAVANATPVNVYRSFMLAKDAFVVTTLDKNHMKLIVKQVGSSGVADPLDQVGSAGYKLQFGVKYVGGSFTGHNGASPDLAVQIRGGATGG